MTIRASRVTDSTQLIDRAQIIDVKNIYATGIDRRDWQLFRSIFTEEVTLDFKSLFGREPGVANTDDWIKYVQGSISGFDSTQHVFTNSTVDLRGKEATLVTYMNAHHYLVEDRVRKMHSIGGYYTELLHRLDDGWKIIECCLTVTWEIGDRELFTKAAARLANDSR